MQNIIRFVPRFIILVLLQVLVLNNLQFLGYINIYLYILLILSLPLQTPKWLTLIIGFALGLTIDIFSNTMGLHAFATVLIAFLRIPVVSLFVSVEKNTSVLPSISSFGLSGYLKYAGILVLIHHVTLFYLETFTFIDFWFVLLRSLLSSICTFIIIIGIQFFSINKGR